MNEGADDIQKQIEERLEQLPADIQNAILSSDLGDKVLAIGTSAKLHIDQIQNLNDLTMLSMLGFVPLQNMEGEISKQLSLPADTARKIASDINAQILLPIRESMKKFTEGEKAITQPSPAPKPALSEILPKSAVTMPSEAAPTPVSAPIIPTPASAAPVSAAPTAPVASVPAVPKIDMHPADIALTQKTVAIPAAQAPVPASTPAKPALDAKVAPPKPQDYKADPYREPIN